MSNKAAFLLRDFNLNVLDYDTKEVVKSFSNLFFQNGFLSKDRRELLEQAPLPLTIFYLIES